MKEGYLKRLKENQDEYGLTKLIQINKEMYKEECVANPIIKFINKLKRLYNKMQENYKPKGLSWR